MVPSIRWMKKMFNFFNRKYFGSQLKEPTFSLQCPSGHWGYYKPRASFNRFNRKVTVHTPGTLYLTTEYSRKETDVISTLLHEMIHMYIYTVQKVSPRNEHGDEFMQIARQMLADGWNIEEETMMSATDVPNDGSDEEDPYTSYRDPGLIYVLFMPLHPVCKVWAWRGLRSDMRMYMETCKSLGHSNMVLRFYECYTEKILNIPEGGDTLVGYGGNSVSEVMNSISAYIGEQLTTGNTIKIHEIPIRI